MSEQQRNVDLLRPLYEKWGDRTLDTEPWMHVLADEVQWRSVGDGGPGLEFSSPGRSRQDVERYFRQLAEEWEMLHYTVERFVAEDDRVVMIGHCSWKSKKTGKSVETPKVDIHRLRDGKVIEFFELFDTAKARDAATAS